jgi:LysM repeat protein
MLKEKYQDVLSLGEQLKVQGMGCKEEGGKLQLWGTAPYTHDKNQLWDKIKSHSGWETEVAADIKIADTSIHGLYTVEAGDTLSKIAKMYFGEANRYMEIFNINKDQLSDPDKIQIGQKLKLPNK